MEDYAKSTSAHDISDLDDAFSDGEEGTHSVDFSLTALRADLANSYSHRRSDEGDQVHEDVEDFASQIEFSNSANDIEVDPSISTFDLEPPSPHLNGGISETPGIRQDIAPPEPERPIHADSQLIQESELGGHFDQISLAGAEDARDVVSSVVGSTESADTTPSLYPKVHIDASDSGLPNRADQATVHTERGNQTFAHDVDYPSVTPKDVSHTPSSDEDENLPNLDCAPPVVHPFAEAPTTKPVAAVSTSSLAPTPPPATSSNFSHKSTRSISGPSTFEQVMSRTRPTFLPPKPKGEDLKHLADWEEMMRNSRAAGKCTFLLSLFMRTQDEQLTFSIDSVLAQSSACNSLTPTGTIRAQKAESSTRT
jgi:TBC1 domain family member 14